LKKVRESLTKKDDNHALSLLQQEAISYLAVHPKP
jgi:hypothetical protein